jgi:hypothetical protein
MRKLAIFICAVALLLVSTNIATATKPTEESFTIDNISLSGPLELVFKGKCLAKFSMAAEGDFNPDPESLYFDGNGTFSYNEKGVVNWCTGHGTNQAVMTVSDNNSGDTVTIRWQGQITNFTLDPYTNGDVSGNFVVLSGTGDYEHLHGQGTYIGDFSTVTFTGRFHYDPQ